MRYQYRALLVLIALSLGINVLHASGPLDHKRGFRLTQRLGYNKVAEWELSYKYDYYYDQYQPGLSDSCMAYDYDEDTGTFDHQWTHYVTYAPDGKVTDLFVRNPQSPGAQIWCHSDFDAQGRFTYGHFAFQPEDQTELLYARQVWATWNADQLAIVIEKNDLLEDLVYYRSSFVLDDQGRITSEIRQSSPDSLSWMDFRRYDTLYHPHDIGPHYKFLENRAYIDYMPWITGDLPVDGMPLSYTTLGWNGYVWHNLDRIVYEWDYQDRLTMLQEETWYNATWTAERRDLYSYDSWNHLLEAIDQGYYYGWVDDYKYVYQWEQFSPVDDPAVPSPQQMQLSVYPMPFRESVSIECKGNDDSPLRVDIFNQRGQIVCSLDVPTGAKAVWDGCDASGRQAANGIYLIRAEQNGRSVIGKAVKLP